MKIYLVGSVASGKTTLARRISQITGIPCAHLDEVVYVEDPTDSWGNTKRPIEERDRLFQGLLAQKEYLMEDAGRECFIEGMRQADQIVLLETSYVTRRKRILLRWFKQNLGIESCIYKPNLGILRAMFRWAKSYDRGTDGTKQRVAQFREKVVVLHNNREIEAYLKKLPHAGRAESCEPR